MSLKLFGTIDFMGWEDRLEGEGVGNKCEEKHETESISSEKEN